MDKHYDPAALETRWYETWLARGAFHADPDHPGKPYTVMIPPPNVTGILHMGHALNNTLQDILCRRQRMRGRNVLWMPGTDHAGIATQNVVERALRKEGKHREDLGREAFIQRVRAWREAYGGTIVRQLKMLGASCDWARERFTMDDGLSDAVAEVFVRLYAKGLIHRANYIINWCPRCHTALSDEESEHQDQAGKLWHIRYPVRDAQGKLEHIVVATTRPETMLGDTAVAVHPQDARYAELATKTVSLPVLERELRVIRDDYVDPAFGTGVVKVTPAHDPNDFAMSRRHDLAAINVMNGDGTMNEAAGPYAGMDRFACRQRLVADLEALGLIAKIEDHRHAVGHCYRCDTVVEPRLSPQWFVRMAALAAPALEAVRAGRIQFVPGRWTKVYEEWMENIRDWCISRQIWWGHRIPVFTCDACHHEWAAKGRPETCPACGKGRITQDPDVLDTWFSSWLWPFSTLGWPAATPELQRYYPTQDLCTASEIIFFWVARMIMAGLEFAGDIPFDTVYIHGTVRDDKGRKMSKSLGNALDPIEIIREFSADALRFSLIMLTATGQDVYISKEKFEIGRHFGTKLWNAARFMTLQQKDAPPDIALQPGPAMFDPALLTSDDRHMLARLNQAVREVDRNIEQYRFNDAAHAVYDLVWHAFCDWYLEYAKEPLYGNDPARRAQVLRVMHLVFSVALRLLHPFMPFLTEELWHAMGYAELPHDGAARPASEPRDLIMFAPWPAELPDALLEAWGVTAAVIDYVEAKRDMIRTARTLRADFGIPPAKSIRFVIKPHDPATAERLAAEAAGTATLIKADPLTIDPGFVPGQATPSAVSGLGTVFMPIEDVLDVAAERARLGVQRDKLDEDLERIARKLNNNEFVTRAPEHVVEAQRERRRAIMEQRDKMERLIKTIT